MSGGHTLERARRMLALPGAWLEPGDGAYLVRTGPDRRARVMLKLDEAGFDALVRSPGLRPREGAGWIARKPAPPGPPSPPAGRPGIIEGVRTVMAADGRPVDHPANLAPSAVAWLARRKDADGRPWLTRTEIAAAERLERDAQLALAGAAVTMQWDALPRAGSGGRAGPAGPDDRALRASARVEAALAACEGSRAIVEHVCVQASALQAAEQALGLRRRTGKMLLKHGLTRLARHYRIG